ncbi:MAG: alpha/beta hydrolase family protein [Puniceicoccaceae bacterium]
MSQDENRRHRAVGHRLLFGCLAVILLASLFASLIQSSWGRVQVTGLKIPTQNGQWVVADLFKPKAATEDNRAPLIVVVPGFQRSKETLSNITLELARRGFVVISIDPYAQGGSSSSMSRRAATTEGYGMFPLVDYIASTEVLNYVDRSRIGTTGHSAGGNAAIRGANYFGREAIRTGKPSKLHSVFVSGYVLTLRENVLDDVRSNVGISYALYDEGAYRNELANGDMRRAPEALRLINMARSPELEPVEEVELGQYYGDREKRNLRVVHNERLLHPFQPYSMEATANQVAYFETVFDWDSGLSPENQVWYWKELMTMISLIAAFVSIIPLGRMLLMKVPYFSVLVHPLPLPQPNPQGKGRILFWGLFVVGALIACFSYIPMTELSKVLFVAASSREMTWFFPQRMNNGVMLWALFNGIVGFAIFFLAYHFFGKRNGIRPEMWGTQTSWMEIKRSILLALTLFSYFFLLLFTVYYFFHVDYRFVFFGARVFQPVTLLLLLMYLPMFMPFFFANSLRTNGSMRLEGQAEWKSMLIAGIANSLGLFFIVLVQYVTFALTGTVYWTDGWLYINLLFAVVPIMFILPYFHRYFFRMTGRIYLGPMVMVLVFITILLSNTVSYTPM